jgi:hypothetical protein
MKQGRVLCTMELDSFIYVEPKQDSENVVKRSSVLYRVNHLQLAVKQTNTVDTDPPPQDTVLVISSDQASREKGTTTIMEISLCTL